MKKNKTIFSIAAITGALAITAFNFPSISEQQAPFADKYWVLESSTIVPAVDLDMDGKPDSDIRVMLEDCDKDDAEMFKTGGKIMKHNGKDKCDEEEEDIVESGTWKYDAATKQLTSHHYDTEKPQTLTVKEISGNKMVKVYEFTSNKGKHVITGTYRAK